MTHGYNQCICGNDQMWDGEFDSINFKWKSGSCVDIKKVSCSADADCGAGKCVDGYCKFAKGCIKNEAKDKCRCPPTEVVDANNTCVPGSCSVDSSICYGDLMTGSCDSADSTKCQCKENAIREGDICVCKEGYFEQAAGDTTQCVLETCKNSPTPNFCGAGTCEGDQCRCLNIDNLDAKSPRGELQPAGLSCSCKRGY